MSWTIADIPNLDGKTAVVTGANGGLGLETARALAGAGAHVVMAARNQEKATAAVADILAGQPGASLQMVELDLGSFEAIRTAASKILSMHPTVDILVNNAGLMAMPERRTVDGFEMQLGVNHFGHWVLTADLMPALIASGASRVVTVTSTAHHTGRPVDPENVNMEGSYEPWVAYGRSKLANYHFGLGLQSEFEDRGLRPQSLIAHPGLSTTDLQVRTAAEGGTGRSGDFWVWMAAKTGMSPARGALSQLRAATDPEARGGAFYGPRFANFGSPVRKPILRRSNQEDIETLWTVSTRETGVGLFDRVEELA